ncbi:MAG: glycosyltransferase family 2 protein [Chloroflexaceae bacterium]|jgi:GT2 family glycosyltransferase|nr:glycosyltransferase family 2 protein [Chloroflexaceae bacterium]
MTGISPPTVAVILVHWHHMDDTAACLQSLSQAAYARQRVIVVSNGSTDFDAALTRRMLDAVEIIELPENIGFAAANNVGIRQALAAGADYVLLLNPDTTVAPTLLGELVASARRSGAGIVGPVITYDAQPDLVWFAGGRYNQLLGYSTHPGANQPYSGPGPDRLVDHINGCAMLISRAVFAAVGLLDERFYMYFEDFEFCLRAGRAGFRSLLCNQALVRHKVSASAGRRGSNVMLPTKAYYFGRNPFLMLPTFQGIWRLTGWLSQFAVVLPFHLVQGARAGDVGFLGSYLRGMADGLRGKSGPAVAFTPPASRALPATIAAIAARTSVVLRTYTEQRWDTFVPAVESVLAQTVTPAEVVVVVDHNPALCQRVRARFPQVQVVENPYEAGSSGAWNACVSATRGEIIVFFDDDAVARPDWLAHLLAHYQQPDVLGVGGAILPRWVDGRPAWFPEEFNWVVGCTYRGLPTAPAAVRNLIGCNMSFRRQVFGEIGGFRAELGHIKDRPIGCDETELCIRIGQRWPDHRLVYDPAATVEHVVPASRTTFAYFRERCRLEGRSKALVSHLVGAQRGLASERAYTLRTLPVGVLRGLGAALLRGDSGGLGRAGAIVVGLATTALSYLAARWQRPGTKHHPPAAPPSLEAVAHGSVTLVRPTGDGASSITVQNEARLMAE